MDRWTHYFDEIFLVALPEREQRARRELDSYSIPYTVFRAIKNENNGAQGLRATMKLLFSQNCRKKRILVFEDDVRFVADPNIFMQHCVRQLKTLDWALFYLGINMDNEHNLFERFVTDNILALNFGYSTHAVAYDRSAMKLLYQRLMEEDQKRIPLAFDVLIANIIQPLMYCYCAYPMIATQADGYSYIENKHSSYEYLQQRYDHSVKHLLK